MIPKPRLTPSFCLRVVVNSTPFPSRFDPDKTPPSTTTLFDLGVVDKASGSVFVQHIKSRIFPWNIDDTNVSSSRDTTLQKAANSIQANAF